MYGLSMEHGLGEQEDGCWQLLRTSVWQTTLWTEEKVSFRLFFFHYPERAFLQHEEKT